LIGVLTQNGILIMKHVYKFLSLLILILTFSSQSFSKDDLLALKGPYLGQKPPGLIPEAFAPGIVTTEHYEYSGVFSPDLTEFYFIRGNEESNQQEFVVFRNQDNRWSESIVSPRMGQPFIAPDGKTMHLGRRYMSRTETGWSEPQSLGVPFEDLPIMRLSVSSKGTYFFDEFKSDLTGSIRYSRKVNGRYEEPGLLGETINSGQSFHPFISPDESYIIFDSKRASGHGDSDLYISYRLHDGSWDEAINLGNKINTEAWEASASVTPDGKYLFFNRNMGSENYENVDIFWVDAQFIENLRPK
jgi:hypothetical protein